MLLGQHEVVLVEVPQVVGRNRTQLVEQTARELHLGGEVVAVRGQKVGQHVTAVDVHSADPRQVVEADLVDDHAAGLDPEQRGDRALEADCDVAQTDGAVAGVEQCPRHDPDGVREVDDPRVGLGERAHAVGDAEDDRHGSQGLREAAGAGRLLADAAAREREGLVDEPCLLAADPDLDQDVVGVLDGPVEVVGHLYLDAGALSVEHPLRHRADHLAPLGVDVLEHELADSERVLHAGEPGHELRRVRRTASDHCDLHQPFTPVSVMPSTNAFWASRKRMITGIITTSVAAIVRFHSTWCSVRNWASPTESVQLCGFSPV